MFKVEVGNPVNQTIIFLHGGGLDHTQWKEVMHHLSPEFHCVAVDLPMHGQSTHIPLTMDGVLHRLEDVCRQYGQVHLVGLSLGGAIVLTALSRFPQFIKSAVISGTTTLLSEKNATRLNKYIAPMYRLLKPEWVTTLTMKGFNIPPRFQKDIQHATKSASVEQVRAMYTLLSKVQLPMLNQVPLLVLAGGKENRLVKNSQYNILSYVKRSKAAIVPSVGHAWSYENPLLFAEVVQCWCEEQPIHFGLKTLQ
ncbi:alpha/beta hydrolase [Lysinibacillus sp. KU-BSD001]|uniref:alpha/beta fold hydrolase n=1 Tax=Lysinibacillus sp. KU-BSD001 TaxID=3141328 RepID=UPI0036E71327